MKPQKHPPGAMNASIQYRPEIDGLRALAVIPVVLFHAGWEAISGGYLGVDVFFVISGYLITSITLAEREAGRFSLARFYERRARRILPALLLVLLACMVPAWMLLPPDQLKGFGQSLVAVSFFSSNILFWLTSGYFAESADEKPLLHTWSLGVEEQYYLLAPLLLMLLWPSRRRWLIGIYIAVALASLAYGDLTSRHSPSSAFYLLPSRAWELCTGALIAFASIRRPLHESIGRWLREILAATGLSLVLFSYFVFDRHTPGPGILTLVPIAGVACVIAFGAHTWTGRLLAWRGLVSVGLISYSAYLWHQPLFVFARASSFHYPSAGIMAILAVATFVLAYFSWRFVETPLRHTQLLSGKRLTIIALLITLLCVGFGLAAHITRGFPQRFGDSARATAEAIAFSPMRSKCHTAGIDFLPPERACTYFKGPTTWAVLGDSHGVELAYALALRLLPREQAVLQLTFSACPPALLFEATARGCNAWLEQAMVRIEQDPSIHNVLVNFRNTAYLFGNQVADYPNLPHRPPNFRTSLTPEPARELFWQSYEALLKRLHATGKKIYVLLPLPELGAPIHKSIFFDRAGPQPLGPQTDYYQARHKFVLDRYQRLRNLQAITLIDPVPAFCKDNQCYAVADGIPLYFDDDHPSMAGALRVIDRVLSVEQPESGSPEEASPDTATSGLP